MLNVSSKELIFNTQINFTSVTINTKDDVVEVSYTPLETWEVVAKAIPLIMLIVAVIFGNLLVVISVLTQKSLQTPSNVFIFSLALTDLSVGFLMPMGVSDIVMGFHEKNRWYFGELLCRIFMTLSYTACIASIFHLTAIAIDRYRIISEGVSYMSKRSMKKSGVICVCLWFTSLWMSSAPVFGWNTWEEDDPYRNIVGGMNCALPSNLGYIIYTALGAIIVPCIVMIIVYVMIYLKIKEKSKQKMRLSSLNAEKSEDQSEFSTEMTDRSRNSKQIREILQKKVKFSLTKERKAARTLGIIIGAFLICWTPFALVYLATGVCSEMKLDCFHHDVIRFVTMLLCVNSALNPIIYTIYSQEFRKAFRKILRLPWHCTSENFRRKSVHTIGEN